ncbi:MAG: 16S rRNA (cytosine(1402)-N(4))-methyltransferase RsmH [Myxococcota bacterium]
MASQYRHEPVLLAEALSYLFDGRAAEAPGPLVVVDGTLGGGGHAQAILERTAPDGILVGLDVDDEALVAAQARLAPFGERARIVRSSFRVLDRVLEAEEIDGVDGVLLDLGVSSRQLDAPERGFRFGADAAETTPLDMRMDPTRGASAAALLASASQDELERCFRELGELRGARKLARAIVARRDAQPFATAADLLRVVRETGVGGGRAHNPATLVFQALRIAVNDELGALRDGLDAAVSALRPGGRLVVIAYHSLEDRIVKQHLRLEEKGCECPREVPVCVCGRARRLRVLTRKPVVPSAAETRANPRARSARLRAAERVDVAEAA